MPCRCPVFTDLCVQYVSLSYYASIRTFLGINAHPTPLVTTCKGNGQYCSDVEERTLVDPLRMTSSLWPFSVCLVARTPVQNFLLSFHLRCLDVGHLDYIVCVKKNFTPCQLQYVSMFLYKDSVPERIQSVRELGRR